MKSLEEIKKAETALLTTIKDRLPALDALLKEASSHWGYEDPVYRFYHQSWKVYSLQEATKKIVAALADLLPGTALNPWFSEIVAGGTGKQFEKAHNERWAIETRPIVEAFFHARFMLEMACRYGRELDEPPERLPSGWAALLYLYGLR